MSPRCLLLLLSPLLLAALALGLREARRSAPLEDPSPGEAQALPGTPAFVLALPLQGRWDVIESESSLRLTVAEGAESATGEAASLRGSLALEQDGRLSDLDIEARLSSAAALALVRADSEGHLALRAASGRSLPGAVPGSHTASLEAWLAFDGRRRAVPLRAAWMPCGPGRLRLQLEAGWDGDAGGDDDTLCTLLGGRRTSALALDLVLARS